ncbi:MAG: hypothetical protein E7332_02730 [Clostridiales bacterium]|nr:hypothetical protein [Clostridiales bacterium]
MNCLHFHPSLSDDNNSYHIHYWCSLWETVVYAHVLADRMGCECPFYDDLETGDAFCYMFEPVDVPTFPDEWFDKNKAENELNAKRNQITEK